MVPIDTSLHGLDISPRQEARKHQMREIYLKSYGIRWVCNDY